MNSPRQLREAMRRLVVAHGALDEVRRPCGTPLSVPHAYALLELLSDGPLTVSALSERLSIDRTNVSRLCSRMESKGELLREPHPEDGRAVQLRLTAHGKDVARTVDAASAAHFEEILDHLGVNGEQVIEALGRLVKALTSSANQQRYNQEL